jgi:pimeloyl-ACP methyl ester carboxylesterase
MKRAGEVPGKRVLIFHPGIGAYKESYVRFLDRLAPYYSSIYCIDLPEQGSKGRWRIGVMTDNLRELVRLIDNENVDRIDLGGHSAGALAVLSFLLNYNSDTEQLIIDSLKVSSGETALNRILKENGFSNALPEIKKIRCAFLFSPPYSFDSVISNKLTVRLGSMSRGSLRRLMNFLVNYPLRLVGTLSTGKYFRFSVDRSNKVQFFRLTTDDHKSLMEYISGYITPFELYNHLDSENKQKLELALSNYKIVIQLGGNDWVAGNFIFQGNNREELFRIAPGIITHKHRLLGHLLRRRLSPDVNLNLQALTHGSVTRMTTSYI